MKLMRHATEFLKRFSVVGLLVGTVFFAFSLTPSLLPRTFVVQGLISGLSFAAGYAAGCAGRWLWDYLELPVPRRRNEWLIKLASTLICVLIAGAFLWQASEWQNTIRTLMEMEEVDGVRPYSIALIATAVFAVLLVVARGVRHVYQYLARKLQRFVPPRLSFLVGVILVISLFWSLIDGVLITVALRAADNSYQQVDALIEDDMASPEDPLKPGGPGSLLDWADLGRQGRSFVDSTPTAERLSSFLGEPAPAPLRVYAGLNSAETPEATARLALEELKRVGGFQRSVLLLVTPTGSGFVDPISQRAVEYLHRGDIATVAAQYSYLPSPLSLMVEGAYGAETARALFEEVYGHWTELPPDNRPELYLHGLSLGALNSDRSFELYDIIDDPFQGVLWSGPPFRSETWQRVTQRREEGSPPWLPRFRGGSVVRFMNQQASLERPGVEWGSFRIAYLQYASDPVTFFEPESFYREPEWMREPRGPDVSPDLRWFPVVTMLQLAADMAAGSAPRGYGHDYSAEDYIEAWRALTEPGGWSEADLRRLRERHTETGMEGF